MSMGIAVKRRIRQLRRTQNLSQEELTQRIGTTNQHIGRLEKIGGGAHLDLEWIERLASGLGVPATSSVAENELAQPAVRGAPEGFNMIPRYAVRASAGTGLSVLTEDVIDALAFRTDWLRRMVVDPARGPRPSPW